MVIFRKVRAAKFPHGQQYAFYMELTERIDALVREVEAKSPGALSYKGMNFMHAFEALLYFGTVLDAGLNTRFEARAGLCKAISPLERKLAGLMSEFWFAERPRISERVLWQPKEALRGMRNALRRHLPGSRSHFAPDWAGDRPNVAFFVRSVRFARFFLPIARALSKSYVYLVPAAARAVQDWANQEQIPFAAIRPRRPSTLDMGEVLQTYAPDVAALADGMEAILSRLRPRVVVVPEGNTPEDEILNQIGKKLGVPVVCLQHGWSPIPHPGFRNMSYASMFVWGPRFADLLAPFNPHQRFVSVGNHALPMHIARPAWERGSIVFFCQGWDNWLGGRRSGAMLLDLAEWFATAHPLISVRVRPHPLDPLPNDRAARLTGLPNVTIDLPERTPIADSFADARATVTVYSTTILESVATGSIPLIFNSTTLPRYWPDVAEAGAAVEVKTFDEAKNALEKLAGDDELLRAMNPRLTDFAQRFFLCRGEEAIENIVRELERFAC